MNIFICLENAKSWLGEKRDNMGAKPPGPQRSYQEREYQAEMRKRRHEQFPDGINDKSAERDHALVRSLMKKDDFPGAGCTVGVAASGSLPSMTKRLIVHQGTLGGGKIDTIVFIGHATEVSMSVGVGQYAFTGPNAERIVSYKKREISMENVTSWTPTFQSIAGSVDVNDNGCINVFFLGCDSGSGSLLRDVAKQLKHIFQEPVIVYGFVGKCDVYEINHVLTNLKKIVDTADPFSRTTGSIPVHELSLVFAVAT